jgi:CheY-like chemotaxis protein
MNSRKAVLVDDNPVDLFYLDRLFQHRRYQVASYSDPVMTPLHRCKACPCELKITGCPDIIVSDFNMPRVNGVEFVESFLNKGCQCRHIAIISGDNLKQLDLNRMAKHRTRFFTKPLDLDDFYDWLDQIEQGIFEPPPAGSTGRQ